MKACAWCRGPIPSSMRSDAVCCSVRCRQARHRFVVGVGPSVASDRGAALRLAYADPPYPGKSKRYYGDHPDFAGEVDHGELIGRLMGYDGWALSTSASALPMILSLCPRGVRVAAWHRGDRGGRSAGPLNAWEPVIYAGGRLDVGRDASFSADDDASRQPGGDASSLTRATRDAGADLRVASAGEQDASSRSPRRVDSLIYPARARSTDPARVVGAKPAAFCRWVFDLLGAQSQDEFDDIFPGSGGVSRAWAIFSGEEGTA